MEVIDVLARRHPSASCGVAYYPDGVTSSRPSLQFTKRIVLELRSDVVKYGKGEERPWLVFFYMNTMLLFVPWHQGSIIEAVRT